MGFVEAVKTCFRKFVTFSGRATRSEYWWFALFIFLGSLVMETLDYLIFDVEPFNEDQFGIIGSVFQLGVLLPSFAAG